MFIWINQNLKYFDSSRKNVTYNFFYIFMPYYILKEIIDAILFLSKFAKQILFFSNVSSNRIKTKDNLWLSGNYCDSNKYLYFLIIRVLFYHWPSLRIHVVVWSLRISWMWMTARGLAFEIRKKRRYKPRGYYYKLMNNNLKICIKILSNSRKLL